MLETAGTPSHVIDHCINVTRIAMRLGSQLKFKGYKVNMRLMEAGALLHDIGRSETHGIDHAVKGAQILESMGMPDKLTRLVEVHIGGGIPAHEAEEMGLPHKNYFAKTLEEKIVAYADKLVKGRNEVPIEVTIEEYREQHGEDHPSVERLQILHNEITKLLEGPVL